MDGVTGFEPRSLLSLLNSPLLFDCVVLLYWFTLVSRSNSLQFMGPIPFLITLVPPSAPSHSLSSPPSPLNPGQCLSVSEADSIDLRNHSISFSSSHRLTTKEKKKPTLYTHHKRKKQTSLAHHRKKKKHLSPTQLHSLCQTIQSLTCFTPSLLQFFFFSRLSLVLPFSLVQKHMFDGQKIFGCCRK